MSNTILKELFGNVPYNFGEFDVVLLIGSEEAELFLRKFVDEFDISDVWIYDWNRSGLTTLEPAEDVLDDLVVQNVIVVGVEQKLVCCYCADYMLGVVLCREDGSSRLTPLKNVLESAMDKAGRLISYYENIDFTREDMRTWRSLFELHKGTTVELR